MAEAYLDELPSGLVGAGYVHNYSSVVPESYAGLDACPEPFESVEMESSWVVGVLQGGYAAPVVHAPGTGTLHYCTTPDLSDDFDGDGCDDSCEPAP